MPVIKCKHCGAKAQARVKKKKFCSKKCSDAARCKILKATRVPALKPRICEHCSKQYQPKTSNQRFCSLVCHGIVQKQRLKEQRDAARQQKCCPVCTGFFYPKSGIHRYCSTTCRGVAERQMDEAKKEAKRARREKLQRERDEADWTPPKPDRQFRRRECVTCGEVFRPGHSQQKTCSQICRDEHRANVNRRCAKDKKEERALAAEAFELLTARLERKKEVKTEITGETNYSVEIEAFLAKGGKVQVYPVIWSPDVFNSMPEEIF